MRAPGPRTRAAILAVLALVITGVVLRRFLGSGAEVSHAGRLLGNAGIGWISAAIACEGVSYLAYASAQRRLVRACGHRLSVGWLASLALAAQAIIDFLPAGYIAANLFNFREIRRTGIEAAPAAWVLLTTSVLYIGALAGLTLIGGEIPGSHQSAALGAVRLAALATLGAMALAGLAILLLGRRGAPGRWLDAARARLREVKLSRRDAARAIGVFALAWLADAACLTLSFLAIGSAPPWGSLLLAYCAAQLVSFLPITPGGLGVVEGSLTLALVAGGAPAPAALAAVLLYRLISYWGTLPAGGVGFVAVRRWGRSRGVLDPAPAVVTPAPAVVTPAPAVVTPAPAGAVASARR